MKMASQSVRRTSAVEAEVGGRTRRHPLHRKLYKQMKEKRVEVTLTIREASTTRHDALPGGGSSCQHCETKDCQHFGAPAFIPYWAAGAKADLAQTRTIHGSLF
jgi:hypothetical protein